MKNTKLTTENEIVEVSLSEISTNEVQLAGTCAAVTHCVAATADFLDE